MIDATDVSDDDQASGVDMMDCCGSPLTAIALTLPLAPTASVNDGRTTLSGGVPMPRTTCAPAAATGVSSASAPASARVMGEGMARSGEWWVGRCRLLHAGDFDPRRRRADRRRPRGAEPHREQPLGRHAARDELRL